MRSKMRSLTVRISVFCAVIITVLCALRGLAFAEIKIGLHVPLTGFAAADGQSALGGVTLAVKQVNDKGGLDGEKIKLIVYDDQADPEQAVAVAHKLVEEDQVIAAISGSYSDPTQAAAPIFQGGKTPYITAYAIHPKITLIGDYIFRSSAVGEVLGRASGKLASNLGKKRIVLITLNNDFGHSLASGMKDSAARLNLQILDEHEYDLEERQFGEILEQSKAANPDLIYISGYYSAVAPLVIQLRAAGMITPLICQVGYGSEKFVALAGAAAEGVYVTISLDRDFASPVTKAFLDDYKANYKVSADMIATSSYTAAIVLIEGMNKSGGRGGYTLRDAIATGVFNSPTGILSFNNLHEVRKDVQVQIVRKGILTHHSIISDSLLLAPPTKDVRK